MEHRYDSEGNALEMEQWYWNIEQQRWRLSTYPECDETYFTYPEHKRCRLNNYPAYLQEHQ